MSPRIPPLSYRKVARLLRTEGFAPVDQEGSHVRWAHPDGRWTIVPHHAREDIRPVLVKRILEQAGLDPDQQRR
jgi:predicted RNA binding protein YcfA (HicA-like mRNA interferase family)